jgi:putative membrane protein
LYEEVGAVMGWFGNGAGWAMMIGNWVFLLLIIAVVVWAIVRAVPPRPGSRDAARDILDRRFGAGDLDAEAYRHAIRELSAGRNP